MTFLRNTRAEALALALACLLAGVAAAQQPAGLAANPRDLVRAAIQNELSDVHHTIHFSYRSDRRKPSGTETKEIVETKDGSIGRLVAINGKPLNDEQREKEDKRLQRYATDPEAWRQKLKEQKDDEEHVTRMLKAMPDAFIFTYAGTTTGKNGDELVKLSFKPDPNFKPQSREAEVFAGMAGTTLIDAKAKRIAEINAHLVQDVTFGWGILGHLDKGGRFEVVQQPVGEGRWDTTHMMLDFTGKALVFKTIKIQQDETTSDYQPVQDMNVAQAVNFLKRYDENVAAENHNGAQGPSGKGDQPK